MLRLFFRRENMIHSKKEYNTQSGNVLFLILIAVALFAALSYAVTQSTRSGGGSADRETSILNAATLTQYPAALRTSVIRMILNGTNVEEINFDSPGQISALTTPDTTTFVFHPSGGGAVFQTAPADVVTAAGTGSWSFNGNFDIAELGTTDEANANDLIAFLPNVTGAICRQINNEVNIDITGCTDADSDGIPDIDVNITEANIDENMIETGTPYVFPTADQEDLVLTGCTAMTGQPTGCFDDRANDRNVFYSTLLER